MSAQASTGPILDQRDGVLALVRTRTSARDSSVRVLPVPEKGQEEVRIRVRIEIKGAGLAGACRWRRRSQGI